MSAGYSCATADSDNEIYKVFGVAETFLHEDEDEDGKLLDITNEYWHYAP